MKTRLLGQFSIDSQRYCEVMLHVKKCLKKFPLFSTCHGVCTVRLNHPSKQKACQIEYDCWSSRKMSNYDVTKVGLIISLISKVWEWFRKGVKHCKPFLATIRKNRDMGLCTPRTIIFLQETITLIFFLFCCKAWAYFPVT